MMMREYGDTDVMRESVCVWRVCECVYVYVCVGIFCSSSTHTTHVQERGSVLLQNPENGRRREGSGAAAAAAPATAPTPIFARSPRSSSSRYFAAAAPVLSLTLLLLQQNQRVVRWLGIQTEAEREPAYIYTLTHTLTGYYTASV